MPEPSLEKDCVSGSRPAVSARRLVPLLVTGVLLLAVFVLPYRGAPGSQSVSASWEFGFSNGLARDLIALLLLTLFACRMAWPEAEPREGPLSRAVLGGGSARSIRPLLIATVLFQGAACGLLTGWHWYLPYAHYGEMAYFIQRLDIMLLGRIPFRDFHFDYGPAMIWGPMWLYGLCHGSLSIDAAYLVTLLIHYVLGFLLIAYAVWQVGSRAPALVFTLLAFPFLNLTMGLNYGPLRFAIAPACFLAMRDLQRRFPMASASHLLVLSGAGFGMPVIAGSISPEMGLALAAAFLVYFPWFLVGGSPMRAIPALAVAASGIVVLLRPEWFANAFDAGRGGLDFPLLPTVQVLAMLGAASWLLPRLGAMALRRAGAEASFCAGLAALLLLLLLPATGRSDPGHVFLNNLGLFLVVLSAATWGGARIKYALLAGFAVAFPLLGLMSFWNDYRPAFERAIISRRQLAGVSFARESLPPLPHLSKLLPIDPWLNGLPRIPIGLPMGADEATERFFTLTGRAIPEYYIYPHSDLVEPGQLARKFADLERMACVYVPNYYLDLLNASDPANDAAVHAARDNAFLSGLLMFPVRLPAINPPFNPDAEIMERIARDYTLMRRCPAGVLLRRRNP